MADIDFSSLPQDSSLTLAAWIKSFGLVKFVLICLAILVLLLLIGFGLPVPQQNLAEYGLALIGLLAVYLIYRTNARRELTTMRSFAAANSFRFGPGQKTRRQDLPESVAGAYTARNLNVHYRITGSIHDNPFTLYQVYGDYNMIVVHSKTNLTVLETTGSTPVPPKLNYITTEPLPNGVRVILQGNAISQTDMAAMFATAGLIG